MVSGLGCLARPIGAQAWAAGVPLGMVVRESPQVGTQLTG